MGNKYNILDSLIAVAMILFIISTIIERITQLIRKYSPFIKPGDNLYKLGFIRSFWRNINKRQNGTSRRLDTIIEREVSSLSFIISLIVSTLFRVDLFKMFKATDPRSVLFWSKPKFAIYENKYEIILLIISLSLTSFFLTFGSKFFHDLIDMLLQIKNLKRKLVDDETYKVDSIEQFDDYIEKSYSNIIQIAIEQNRGLLQHPESISPLMHGKTIKDDSLTDCIDIHLSGNSKGSLPTTVYATLQSGKVISVPVKVVLNVEIPIIQITQLEPVAYDETPNYKGTICCKIRNNKGEYLLTCSHLVTNGKAINLFGEHEPKIADISGKFNGYFTWSLCTDRFDMALIDAIEDIFKYEIIPKKERIPKPSDILSTKVRIVCRDKQGPNKSIIKEGYIINDRVTEPTKIKYADGNHEISNLMYLAKISTNNGEYIYSPITEKGDSGACVYDNNDRPIGMIIAGNNAFSYAIPIVDILSRISAVII